MFDKKMMEKKKPMSANYKKAKGGLLESLRDEMSGLMAGDLKNVKKDSKSSGLKQGLDKAEKMMDDNTEETSEVCDECGGTKHPKGEHIMADGEEAINNDDNMSLEDMEQAITELEGRKRKKMMKGE